MALKFKVPGKTFLAGEYLVLHGGPACVMLTEPCFELAIGRGTGSLEGIHPQSPAGKFFALYKKDFEGFQMSFRDPYQGKGGFGASTAQFLGLYSFRLLREGFQQDMEKLIDYKELLETYYSCAWDGQGVRPSGADLVGQLKGALTLFDKQSGNISVKKWPFTDIEAFLVHTGNKIATHEHLKNISDFDPSELKSSFNIIRQGLDEGVSTQLIDGVNLYAQSLEKLSLTCPETLKLLRDLRGLRGVVAAKGCGALGADVVLVLCNTKSTETFLDYCKLNSLSLIASSKNISQGLRMEGSL